EKGAGKSTLLHSIFYALRGDQVEGYVYRLEPGDVKPGKAYLFDAEQHNPRTQLDLFKEQPEMVEFLRTASHGQIHFEPAVARDRELRHGKAQGKRRHLPVVGQDLPGSHQRR